MCDQSPGAKRSISTTAAATKDGSVALPREICVLTFPFEDVLVQGETKELRLYEDRYVKAQKQKIFKLCSSHAHRVVIGLV